MRVLITGADGFVGPYVAIAVRQAFDDRVEIVATSRHQSQHASLGNIAALDVTDAAAAKTLIAQYSRNFVIHLAGIAAPALANADWRMTWQVHVQGTLNIAHAILEHAPRCALLFAGSGQVYGASTRSGRPMDEETVLDPIDEYSATKAAADLALGALACNGLRAVRLRPFNHIGPGQNENFAIPSFAAQIARIETGMTPPIIRVGNLDAERDFLDVRDVAAAYALAARNIDAIRPGAIFNVASGIGRRIGDILAELIGLSTKSIVIEHDPTRVRAGEVPRIVGNAELAKKVLGWVPRYRIEQTLAAVLHRCRDDVRTSRLTPNCI